jgi:hypothetical protein
VPRRSPTSKPPRRARGRAHREREARSALQTASPSSRRKRRRPSTRGPRNAPGSGGARRAGDGPGRRQ